MSKFIKWLEVHRAINIILLLLYYLLVVLPHEEIGKIMANIFGHLPREKYNLIMLAIGLVLTLLVLVSIYKKLLSHPYKTKLFIYLVITLILVVLCINILFVMNVEGIHFVQYACFAILCYPLFNNHTQTLVFATLAGALDEAYQYFYLAPQRTEYYDWNDVIINLIGAAIGLLIVIIIGVKLKNQVKPYLKSFSFYSLITLCITVIVLFITGVLTLYPDAALPNAFALVREIPEGFWSYPPGPYVKYHVVTPLEGVIIITILFVFYFGLDKVFK